MKKSITKQQRAVVVNMIRTKADELRQGTIVKSRTAMLIEEFGWLLRLLGFKDARQVVIRALKDQGAELVLVPVPPLSLRAQARARAAAKKEVDFTLTTL